VGIDCVKVSRLAASIATFGDRFLRRVFTDHELKTATGDDTVRAARLAARFAAKEATVKVLRPESRWIDWRSIEVIRYEAGHCEIALHGAARELAERAGIRALSVSMTHEEDLAAAVVVGEEAKRSAGRLRTVPAPTSERWARRPHKARDGASRYRT
jgi:holo-[acyl-carrier protein] synthase